MGPRKFWRAYLPRLKYHNPSVAMTVERTADQEGPASLVVSFAPDGDRGSSGSGSGSGSGSTGEEQMDTQKSINCKHRTDDQILEELMRLTKGRAVEATATEEQQLRDLETERVKSEKDRRKMKSVLTEKRRQQRILEQAKNTVEGET